MDAERIRQTELAEIERSVIQLTNMPSGHIDLATTVAWLRQVSRVTARLYFECLELRERVAELEEAAE
jgi:hypothetical protein